MSRSGYIDYDEIARLNLYRGTVTRSIRGRRGQAFLRELAKEMDAMPVKELIAGDLVHPDGACCAIGVVCKARSLDVSKVDAYDPDAVGSLVGIARSMAAEIEYENDEGAIDLETPDMRWRRMRRWVNEQLKPSGV